MTKKFSIILPLPPSAETARWDRVMPQPLFPAGIKTLAVLALQNLHSFDDFVSDAFILIEAGGFEGDEEDPEVIRYQRRMARRAYQDALEVLLQVFYHDFLERVIPLLGSEQYTFEDVISYRAINGICVELSHGLRPRFPYCSAR